MTGRKVFDVPMSPVSDIQAFRNGRWKLVDFMSVLERVLEWTIEDGAPSDFLAHRSCIGVVDPELKTIATMNDVARGYSA